MFEELWRDDRAIEGLPIRLVIALVVGVASLSVMMNTIAGLDTMTVTELDVESEPAVLETAQQEVTLTVVDPDGAGVANATVVVTGDTATLSGVATAETGPNGTATVELAPSLGDNQQEGVLSVNIRPPAGDGYADRRANTDLLVVGR
jgi:hypothetical protein